MVVSVYSTIWHSPIVLIYTLVSSLKPFPVIVNKAPPSDISVGEFESISNFDSSVSSPV